MLPTQFKSMEELTTYLSTLERRVNVLENENRSLKDVINEIGGESTNLSRNLNLALPETNLLSKNFITRAFAVWGHYFIAQLIISLVFLAIYFCFVMLIFVSGN